VQLSIQGTLALAATIAATLLLWDKMPGDATLRSTIRLAPALAFASVILSQWVERAGGRRLSRRSSACEAAVFTLFLVAAATAPAWSPGVSRSLDQALCGVWILLVLHRALQMTVAARPLLERSDRPHFAFLALPFLVYCALLPWQSENRLPDGDEPYNLLLTHSLAHDADLDLANNYAEGADVVIAGRELEPQPGDPVGADGELYSRHNAVLPLLLAPAYRVFGVQGALVAMALLSAALAWMLLAVGTQYFRDARGAVLLCYALFSFTAPIVGYSYQVWVEVPAGLLLLIGLSMILAIERSGELTVRRTVMLIGVIAALPLLKARFALLSLSLIAVAARRSKSRRTIVTFGLALAAAVSAILATNTLLFGNPLKYHDLAATLDTLTTPTAYARGAFGLFFDCGFGLFAAAPIWMLVIPGLQKLWGRQRRLFVDLAILALPYLVIVAPRLEWYGGWGPPFRYAVALLPLFALATVPAWEARRGKRVAIVIVTLAILSAASTLVSILEPGNTYSFADGRSRLLDVWTSSTQWDHARFFPSYVRPRLATWLWPIGSTLLLLSLWGGKPKRRADSVVATWASVAVLALAALLRFSAEHLPTRHIEFEDPYVQKSGGILYPERWRPARAAYRGGWALGAGRRATIEPISGGDRLELEIELRKPGPKSKPARLIVLQGARELCSLPLRGPQEWTTVRCESEWEPESGPLAFRLAQLNRASDRRHAHVVLDRARIRWTSSASTNSGEEDPST